MRFVIFDVETDGLLDEVTKIHCLSYAIYFNKEIIESNSLTSSQEIETLFEREKDSYLVGHNIIRYDIPVLKKLLNIELNHKLVDTLGISWYLFPNQKIHGLEYWGEVCNIPKPIIFDWENLEIQDYIHRCEVDVKINTVIFKKFFNNLSSIYSDFQSLIGIVEYLNYKLDCLREQEEIGIPLDIEACNKHLTDLNQIFNLKIETLQNVMPETLGKILKKKPNKMFLKNGDLSKAGISWIQETSKKGLNYNSVEVIREKPNPGSNKQLKDWLFSLGWQPQTFKTSKSTGEEIPQISLPFGAGICDSVKDLYCKEPNLKELEGYYVIRHRIGLFKSFLENEKDGKIVSTAHAFTNTLRLRHQKPTANLPRPSSYYGYEIRSVLTVKDKDTQEMCGSDISALEDSMKQHFIYPYDPDYVNEMRVPGFDPHLDIGILAGLLTEEDSELYKKYDNLSEEERKNVEKEVVKEVKKIKSIRTSSKTINFASTYGAGIEKIAKTADITVKEAAHLYKVYWKRNHSIKKVVKDAVIKTVICDGKKQKWLFNPVNNFWYFLKAEKDAFNTLNQGAGAFIFDMWLKNVRVALKALNLFVSMQYHDELMFISFKENKNMINKVLKESIQKVNETYNLNVEIDISIDWGYNYSEVH